MSKRDPRSFRPDTVITNAGRNPEDNFGIVNPPVYHASTVTFPTVAAMKESGRDRLRGVHYGRIGTPTTMAFEEAVAAVEGGSDCLSLPSGMAAIAAALLAHVKTGDHVLVTDNAYAPTRRFCETALKGFGVETTYYDPMIGAGIKDLMRPQTKVLFTESPGSHTFEVQDIPAMADVAHAAGALVMTDNTWSAGYFMKAFDLGVDISVHAATKYLVGHSDAMLGTITTKNRELYEITKTSAVSYGYCAGPDDCYLGLRGIRTLAARMARHQSSALDIAEWLAGRPEVERVLHPARPDCPGHDIWKRDFSGSSGLFGVVLKPVSEEALVAMLDGMALFAMGFSWGGYESLIIPSDPRANRSAVPWTADGPLLRLHVGLEDPEDLKADLADGFERLKAAS
ncbi:MAG: cystathionine beta-lyase [Rhodospirillales bacterium]